MVKRTTLIIFQKQILLKYENDKVVTMLSNRLDKIFNQYNLFALDKTRN